MVWLLVSSEIVTPLLKIPLLLSATRLAVLAQSPPTPPPRPDETKKFESVGDSMVPKTVMRRSVLVQNTIYWTNALCETAVILATWAPGFLPTGTLTLLARYPDGARDIRFTATWLSGCLLMHFGSFIRLSCYRALGSNFTWELAVKKGHVLVTTGPYAIVRHPSYVGALSIYVGAFCTIFGPGSWFNECIGWDTTASWLLAGVCGSWALGIPMLLMGRVNREDEVLRREFGEEWEAYAKKVPYKLFPFVY